MPKIHDSAYLVTSVWEDPEYKLQGREIAAGPCSKIRNVHKAAMGLSATEKSLQSTTVRRVYVRWLLQKALNRSKILYDSLWGVWPNCALNYTNLHATNTQRFLLFESPKIIVFLLGVLTRTNTHTTNSYTYTWTQSIRVTESMGRILI